MGSTTGERYIGNVLADIAKNHISRYEWARNELLKMVPEGGKILDAAAGCGYGSQLLAQSGYKVFSFDRSDEALEYSKNFRHENVTFVKGDIMEGLFQDYDAVVSIETIEHIQNDKEWIDGIGKRSPILIGTVPNQDVVPFSKITHKWHERHYTKADIEVLMEGWTLSNWTTQQNKWTDWVMKPGIDGMTLGFVARK